MSRILKIFATGPEQDAVAGQYQIVERYGAFVIAEVPDDVAPGVSQQYLSEDITDQYTIRAGVEQIDTSIPRLDLQTAALPHPAYKGREDQSLSQGKHHYLVQFIGPIKKEWLTGVQQQGGELRDPYGDFTYVVRATEATVQQIAALPYVRWTGHLPYAARLDQTMLAAVQRTAHDTSAALPRTQIRPGVYTVEFFGSDDVSSAVPEVKKLGFEVLVNDPSGKLLVVREKKGGTIDTSQLDALTEVHGVRTIRERAINRPSNDVSAGIMGTAAAFASTGTGLGLSGKGETIGICDTGLDTGDPKHINKDFEKRLSVIKSYPITADFAPYVTNPNGDDGPADLDSGHGTHVAGSVLGNGANSTNLPGLQGPIRGLSFNAKLVFQAVEQEIKWKNPADLQRYGRYLLAGIPTDLKELFQFAYQKKARIHSNSWGGGKPGEYDEQSRQLDQFVWENKDFCVLVAAGNDGTDQDGDGKINPLSVTSPGTAKNCITVGACENRRPNFDSQRYGDWWPSDYPADPIHDDPMANNPDQVVAFSSRGPTLDNRYKPDVVAPGTFILSTRSSMIASNNTAWSPFPPSKNYFYMGGTSMATPLTAGSVGLIREFLRKKKKISKPSAALLKATLIAGAARLPEMPDGSVVDNNQGFGRVNIDRVVAPSAPASSVFTDVKKGLETGGLYTQNLTIQSPTVPLRLVLAYSDYPGTSLVNNLNLILTAPDGQKYVGNQPIGGPLLFDSVNNVEVIEIAQPVSGAWTVQVIGANVPSGPQDFALVCIAHV